MKLVLSNINQLNEILDLVNVAYRGEEGWTRETEFIAGERATPEHIRSAIEDPHSHLLVYLENGNIRSCICLEQKSEKDYIGLFAVSPQLQSKGMGKQVLSAAQEYAVRELSVKKFVMAVVSARQELISYYERRGYERTGKTEDYPIHFAVGTPKTRGLTIEYLEKNA